MVPHLTSGYHSQLQFWSRSVSISWPLTRRNALCYGQYHALYSLASSAWENYCQTPHPLSERLLISHGATWLRIVIQSLNGANPKRSKCDQFGAGLDIVVGLTGSRLCQVKAILDYIDSCGVQPGPFFIDASGRVVTKPWFIANIRTIHAAIGLPSISTPATAFASGRPLQLCWPGWRTPQYRHSADGTAQHSCST